MTQEKLYGLAIDPGMSNGFCLFSWGPDRPYEQEGWWQVPLGAFGLADFLDRQKIQVRGVVPYMGNIQLHALPVEKFTPRTQSEFHLTQDSAEPLRGEGVLIGRGFAPFISWQQPAMQYFMGGTTKEERKARSRKFLKLHGIYITGKMVHQKDADDAISAELHAIAYLRHYRHRPTLDELFTSEEE